MKKTMRFLSMAALALVGAMTVSCNSVDNAIDTPQPANARNVVTLTATVGFDEPAATRALAIDYTAQTLTKTFKAGDKIAVIYENTNGKNVKAESAALTDGDITDEGKKATLTVTLTDPESNGALKYIYPAAMAGDSDVDYSKLGSQEGTLASLASNADLAVYDGWLTSDAELPATAELENMLAIMALKIKYEGADCTSDITNLTLSDGTNTYSITGADTDGHIYAAIQPATALSLFATGGTNNYAKQLTDKDYEANNFYQLTLNTTTPETFNLASVSAAKVFENGSKLTGTLGGNYKISIAAGAIVTLKDVTINGTDDYSYDFAGITCEGDATIILEGTNTVKGFYNDYPGISVPEGKTLTILGTGSLTASSNDDDEDGSGAGIGGGWEESCGNIVISGGTITATGGTSGAGIGSGVTGSCGNITISGGTVTAKGGLNAAGIGSGLGGSCGNITISGGTVTATGDDYAAGIGGGYNNGSSGTITITSGATKVTATSSFKPIGRGEDGSPIDVYVDGVQNPSDSDTFPHFDFVRDGVTWTFTHK